MASPGSQRVVEARTCEERSAVYRALYDVYVDELGRVVPDADHGRRWIHDAEDEQPYTSLYFVGVPADIEGTVRLRHWSAGQIPAGVFERFSMERFHDIERLNVCIIDRLMVRPRGRGGETLMTLVGALYPVAAARWGTDVALAYCVPGLLPHYRSLGMRPYGARLVTAADGVRIPLALLLADQRHLKAIGSFLAPLVAGFPSGRPPLDFGAYERVFESDELEIDRPEVWARVERTIAQGVHDGSTFLGGLSPATMQELAAGGFVMPVKEGTVLTQQGLAQREMFVVLSGVFEAVDPSGRLRLMSSGDVIGEVAFFHASGRRSASVRALADGEVLVLRPSSLDDLRRRNPECAVEVLLRLAGVLAGRVSRT